MEPRSAAGAPQPARSAGGARSFRSLWFVLLLWLPFHWLAGLDADWLRAANLASLCVILAVSLGAVVANIASSRLALWFPMTWFMLTSALYYGFGPLLYYFGTTETVAYANTYQFVDEVALHDATLLNLVGIGTVMGTYLLIERFTARRRPPLVSKDPNDPEVQRELWKITVAFVAVGIPVRLLVSLPQALGVSQVVVPGGLETFGSLALQGLVSGFVLYRASKAAYSLPFYGLLALNLVTAFMTLSKLEIIKVGIALLLAAVLTGTRFRTLMIAGVFGLFFHATVLTPLISITRSGSGTGLLSLSDAQLAIEGYARSGQEDAADMMPGVQGWWNRLNYSSAQTFAISSYDQGRPGETFNLALYAFVPRALYPAKPIMTSGRDFNILVTGNPNSQSAPGIFAEAYWNGGWGLSLLTFVFLGALYWAWEVYARRMLSSFRLAYVPVMWIGLLTAIQQDSWFAATTIGAIPIAIAFHFLARWIFEKASSGPRARAAARA